MTFSATEYRFVADARVARLATADTNGEPHVVPVCHAVVNERIVIALDEKPKRVAPEELKRVRNLRDNPAVSVIVDRYTEEWNELGWVQITGHGEIVGPTENGHSTAIAALTEKYRQYAEQTIADRPLIRIDPQRVRSWGALSAPPKR